jgi:hypothetical protein
MDKIISKSLHEPISEGLDSIKETKFCISQSREHAEMEKKEEFLNKFTLRFSLAKINK